MTSLILLKDFLETQIEYWHPAVGLLGYDVSNLGHIRSYWRRAKGKRRGYEIGDHAVLLNPCHNEWSHGYWQTSLVRSDGVNRPTKIHRVIAVTFVPNPNNYTEVGHINAIRQDSRAANLEWVTTRQNVIHTHKYSVVSFHKLDADKVRAIRAEPNYRGVGQRLSERFGVSPATISEVRSGKIWQFVDAEEEK